MLSVRQCAERLNLSEQAVRRFITSGRLKASKVGRWRVAEADLVAFLAGAQPEPARRPEPPSDVPAPAFNPFL
ncbi:MAG TPA: helix-turn-helix domain-containing protein [Vicinamibacterales bacterium]|nr:helix-turn-helix domain-containing protein [Vicinamibacterales bacterium]